MSVLSRGVSAISLSIPPAIRPTSFPTVDSGRGPVLGRLFRDRPAGRRPSFLGSRAAAMKTSHETVSVASVARQYDEAPDLSPRSRVGRVSKHLETQASGVEPWSTHMTDPDRLFETSDEEVARLILKAGRAGAPPGARERAIALASSVVAGSSLAVGSAGAGSGVASDLHGRTRDAR
jgi:hypothetical protein